MEKKEKKQTPKKHRHFAMSTYISLEEIQEYVKKETIEKYAYILHDKEESEPHYHLVVSFTNPRTWEGVKKDFAKYEQNTLVKVVKSLDGVLDYLTHKNKPEKYQYPEEAITNNGYYRGASRRNTDIEQDIAVSIVEAILEETPKRELLKRFGREYVIYRNRYESLACEIRIEEMPKHPKPALVNVDGEVLFDTLPDTGAYELINLARFQQYIREYDFSNPVQGEIPFENNEIKE